MDSIFKEYGGAIIAAIGAVGIITLLIAGSFGGFNGIYKALGQGMSVQELEVNNVENLAYMEAVQPMNIDIRLTKGDLYSGEIYFVDEMISGTDSEGDSLDVEIYRVTDLSGNAIAEGNVSVNDDTVCFNKKGTYRIYARCRGNKYTGQQFRVCVL